MIPASSHAGYILFDARTMLMSSQCDSRIDHITVFLVVLAVSFLPYLVDMTSSHELSPVSLPSEGFPDREISGFPKPLNTSDYSQCNALIPQLFLSVASFPHSPLHEGCAAQGGSRVPLYRWTSPPPAFHGLTSPTTSIIEV
jgi:hypothetical protein